ncbi:hypothetical protein [Klebsiella pneumoniae]|uniref:hypothetical protein n=1 Tax=Klebsiella pneumoniae TaxID=573 RepID=UPI0011DCDA6E|nr:hypothetical protein [Klebsiella pneumoniae]
MMALKLDVIFKGISISGAIATVGGIILSDDHTSITFAVNYQANGAAEVFNTEYYTGPYQQGGADIITQSYDYLKTVEIFRDAVDA